MKVFEENQRFTQWWLLLLLAIVAGIILKAVYEETNGFKEADNPLFILFIVFSGLIPIVLLLGIQLQTRIDTKGITVKFHPLGFTKKHFAWNEILDCYVKKYSPLKDYGGWGIRGFGGKRAYNVSGNLGIQIVTVNNKKFLIGTRQPEAVKAVLATYQNKLNLNTQSL